MVLNVPKVLELRVELISAERFSHVSEDSLEVASDYMRVIVH